MATMTAKVYDMTVVKHGANVSGDHSSTDTTLSLIYGWDFPELGGQARLSDDSVVDFTAATYPDPDLEDDDQPTVLALDGTLGVDLLDGDFVAVEPEQLRGIALVEVGGSGEGLSVRVRQDLVTQLQEGIRGTAAEAVQVTLDDRGTGTFEVVGIIGEPPSIDGNYLDPDTLPPAEPVEPVAPSSSPTPTLTASGLNNIRIAWTPVENATPVTYDVYFGASSANVGDLTSGTFLESTSASATTTGINPETGAALLPSTNYYAAIRARSEDAFGPDGSVSSPAQIVTVDLSGLDELQDDIDELNNTTLPAMQQDIDDILPITETKISDDAISTPKLQAGAVVADKIGANEVVAGKIAADAVTANEIAAGAVTADKILAEAVTSDKIAANAVNAEHVSANSIEGEHFAAQVVISNEFATAESGERTGMSAEQGLFADGPDGEKTLQVKGGQAYFDGEVNARNLTVVEGASWSGSNLGAPGASTMMGDKLARPGNAPTVEAFYDTITLNGGTIAGDDQSNRRGLVWDGTYWYVASQIGGESLSVLKFDAGGNFVDSATATASFSAGPSSLTLLGGSLWVHRSDSSFAYRFNPSTMVYQSVISLSLEVVVVGSNYTLGTDGTNLILAWSTGLGTIAWQKYNTSGGKVGSEVNALMGGDPRAIQQSTFDFGAQRVVLTSSDGRVYPYTTSGTLQTAQSFFTPGQQVGMTWDGSQFVSLGSNGRTISKYTANLKDEPDTQTVPLAAGVSWYDGAGTTHETAVSPRPLVDFPKRAKYRLRTSGKVPSGGGADDPNGARFYIGRSTGRAKMERQSTVTGKSPGQYVTTDLATLTLPTSSADATNPPPASNNFPASTPYEHYSEATGGTGSPPLTKMDGAGNFWAKRAMQAGQRSLPVAVTDTTYTVSVTFDVPFAAPPTVILTPNFTQTPHQLFTITDNITTTGFDIIYRRTAGTANFNVGWIAMAKTQ